MKTVFLRVLEADDKATALLGVVRTAEPTPGRQRFEIDVRGFAAVPRSPFAYWVTEKLRSTFKDFPPFESEARTAKCGAGTLDDFRFLRLDWEAARGSGRWVPFAKGGSFGRFYSDIHLRLGWGQTGFEIQCFVEAKVGSATRKIQAQSWYFRSGLTWPRRTNGLSFRVMPAGCIFADKGPAVFVENDDSRELLTLASITNSRAFGLLVSLQLARTELAQSYEVGLIQNTPVPRLSDSDREALARLGHRSWSLKRTLDTRTEMSHAFVLPALLLVVGADFSTRATAWSEHVRTFEAELGEIQAEIDERCFALYSIDEADRRAIAQGFGPRDSDEASSDGATDSEDDVEEATDDSESVADSTALAAELSSWAVGVAFGRFDVRLATHARPLPAEPEPFDLLPACSPGMLTGANGLPLARPQDGYPFGFPETGVLVDDPGHMQDLKFELRALFDVILGADAERWWNDIASLLDPKTHDLRVWLAGNFFEHHLKRYSKSRRKAPIYWQLATPSASYSVWLYAHRLTRDSFFQIQKDVVEPKLAHEERELLRITQEAGSAPTVQQGKAIATQESFVAELRAFRDEIALVAPLWNPNLDDGVVITMAPLWRLVPQHKAWQKELKGYWDELCAGQYNWSHLAMHLWPERVVPNCATDRSIAIAHGLEDVFWFEDGEGKWKPRAQPTRSIADLVRERSSPAVKAALAALLSAPTATAGRTRGTKRSPRRTEG